MNPEGERSYETQRTISFIPPLAQAEIPPRGVFQACTVPGEGEAPGEAPVAAPGAATGQSQLLPRSVTDSGVICRTMSEVLDRLAWMTAGNPAGARWIARQIAKRNAAKGDAATPRVAGILEHPRAFRDSVQLELLDT